VTQYKGFDVFEVEPDGPEVPGYSHRRALYRLDSQSGKLGVMDNSGISRGTVAAFDWLMDGRAEVQQYRDFLAARCGALVPVWVPSWRMDLVATAPLINPGKQLQIAPIGYGNFMFPSAARQHLAFLFRTGAKYYRKVVGVAATSTAEVLTLDTALPVALQPGDALISFLRFCRLLTDSVELAWESRDVAGVTLAFTELPREVPTI